MNTFRTIFRNRRAVSLPALMLMAALALAACGGGGGGGNPIIEPPDLGDIQVSVTDDSGAPVANAELMLTTNEGNQLRGYTDTAGQYWYSSVEASFFSISASASGFETQHFDGYLDGGTTESVNFSMQREALPVGWMVDARVVSYTANSATFEIDVIAFDAEQNQYTNLQDSDFRIEDFTIEDRGTTFSISQNYSTFNPGNGNGLGYSAMMLFDQSGSISSTDPNDARLSAAKAFLDNMGPSDNARLAAFASGGSLPHDPITIWDGPTSDGRSYFPVIDSLATMESGGTPLYDAVSVSADVISTANNPNKAVVVFTDGMDTSSTKSIDQAIADAKSRSVELHTVGLSDSIDMDVLLKMALETGGSFMFADDARRLITYYGNLGNVLNGTASFYRTSWNVVVSGGSYQFGPGSWFLSSMRVETPQGTLLVPFMVRF